MLTVGVINIYIYIYIEQNPRDLFTDLAEHTEVVNTAFRVTIEDK